jgi:capsular polysaccharide transport system ATP-binding protein
MIKLENVTKSYPTEKFGRHYVFRGLNLELPSKTHIGILGRNGAGKSTLLRLLGGIELPDRGRLMADGSISPPMGLANGFAAQLTGRDNARFICRVSGDQDLELDARVESIRTFSELGAFFDRPINTYSSGMRARLAFSISMAYRYDYYLIDELTAVGDKQFRDKAAATFAALKGSASIIMASHNLQQIKKDCQIGVYVRRQEDIQVGDIHDIIAAYLADQNKGLS